MLDFGALPPEINSARMYSGPGVGPLLAAASAWDALAAQLELFAAGYSATLSELQSQWLGGASIAMAAALAPYVAWATATATQAEQSATQARAAAAAYETAFIAMVPPPVISANRIRLAILVATNFFGQNTPMIAATEAEYAEMWAQDAAAMYGYAASSSAATVLTPFTEPPRTTNTGNQSSQATAVSQAVHSPMGHTQVALSQLMPALSQQLQTLASGAPTNGSAAASTPILAAFSDFNTLVASPAQPVWSTTYAVFAAGQFGTGLNLANLQVAKAAVSGAAALGSAGSRGPVLASVSHAASVGKLSVPQSWLAENSVVDPCHQPLPLPQNDFRVLPAAKTSPSTNTLGAMPTARTGQRASGSPVLRNGRRTFKMPRPFFGG